MYPSALSDFKFLLSNSRTICALIWGSESLSLMSLCKLRTAMSVPVDVTNLICSGDPVSMISADS